MFDTYQTGKNTSDATCVFAMCSSVAKHLSDFRPDEFDYIVIDEAHRTDLRATNPSCRTLRLGFIWA